MSWRVSPIRGWFRRGSAAVEGPSCRELVELVTDYLEGVLSPAEATRVATHLAACGACATYVEQIRVTIRTVGRVPSETVSPAMEAALVEAFRDWRAS